MSVWLNMIDERDSSIRRFVAHATASSICWCMFCFWAAVGLSVVYYIVSRFNIVVLT